jgi:hypothetical protein
LVYRRDHLFRNRVPSLERQDEAQPAKPTSI